LTKNKDKNTRNFVYTAEINGSIYFCVEERLFLCYIFLVSEVTLESLVFQEPKVYGVYKTSISQAKGQRQKSVVFSPEAEFIGFFYLCF